MYKLNYNNRSLLKYKTLGIKCLFKPYTFYIKLYKKCNKRSKNLKV